MSSIPNLTQRSDTRVSDEALEINGAAVNLFWLRDNCRCDECFNWETHQRKHNDPLKSNKIKSFVEDEKIIQILWDDDHNSRYDRDFIIAQSSNEDAISPHLWTATEIQRELPMIESDGEHLSQNGVKSLVTSLLRLGLAFVNNVNPCKESTEKIVNHVGPLMHTLYGSGMWDIDTELFEEYRDSAYTNEGISCHTDNTYFIEPAGLEVFHCTKPAEKGGETLLVDGFKAAQLLKEQCSPFYESLKSSSVQCQYVTKDYHLTHESEILRTRKFDDRLEQVRFNVYDRSPKAPLTHDISSFYRSFNAFQKILQSPAMQLRVQLQPGTVVLINNWRVLHGRTAFRGNRKLHGCFVGMGTVISKARKLGLFK